MKNLKYISSLFLLLTVLWACDKQDIDVDGTLEMKGKQMILNAKFPIKVADYEIEIPKVVFYNIAEVVEVTLNLTYEKQ